MSTGAVQGSAFEVNTELSGVSMETLDLESSTSTGSVEYKYKHSYTGDEVVVSVSSDNTAYVKVINGKTIIFCCNIKKGSSGVIRYSDGVKDTITYSNDGTISTPHIKLGVSPKFDSSLACGLEGSHYVRYKVVADRDTYYVIVENDVLDLSGSVTYKKGTVVSIGKSMYAAREYNLSGLNDDKIYINILDSNEVQVWATKGSGQTSIPTNLLNFSRGFTNGTYGFVDVDYHASKSDAWKSIKVNAQFDARPAQNYTKAVELANADIERYKKKNMKVSTHVKTTTSTVNKSTNLYYYAGDVDQDGVITPYDAKLLQDMVEGSKTTMGFPNGQNMLSEGGYKYTSDALNGIYYYLTRFSTGVDRRYDVTRNGVVDVKDVQAIEAYLRCDGKAGTGTYHVGRRYKIVSKCLNVVQDSKNKLLRSYQYYNGEELMTSSSGSYIYAPVSFENWTVSNGNEYDDALEEAIDANALLYVPVQDHVYSDGYYDGYYGR